MAVGLLRHRCTAQPQAPADIDWANPITAGLKLVINPADGSRNVVTGAALTRGGTIGTSAKGAGKAFTNNGTGTNYLQSPITYGANVTMFALVQNMSGGTDQQFLDDDDISGGGQRSFQFKKNASNQIEFIRFDTSNSPYFATSSAVTSQLDTGFAAGAMSSGTSAWAWQGKTKGSAATLTGTARGNTSSGTVRALSSKVTGGSNGLNGAVHLLLMWDRCLSDDEYRSIVDNPWQVFTAPNQLYRVLAAAAGSGTATPSGVSATASLGTATATGAANTTPAGVAASASLGSVTASGGSTATANPAGVSATGSIGAPTATGAANTMPAGVNASGSLGSTVATGAANTSPTGVSATTALGTVTASASGNATAYPNGVSAVTSVGVAEVTGAASTATTGVSAALALGAVTAFAVAPTPGDAYPTGVFSTIYLGSAVAAASAPVVTGVRGVAIASARTPVGSAVTDRASGNKNWWLER